MAHLPTPDCVATMGQREQLAAIYDALYALNNDVEGPQVLSATVDATGLLLTIVFDEAANGTAGFTINSDYGPVTVAYDSGEGTATYVYDLSRAIYDHETLTLDYAPGDIEDLNGNPMQAFVNFPITNNSAVAAFLPTSIAGLTIWHDASDLATITKDGGNRVSAWADKSGNARTLTQATGANQPLWVDDAINGLDVLRLDGVSDLMSRVLVQNTLSYTIFAVMRAVSAVTNGVVMFNGNTASNGYGLYKFGAQGARAILHGGVGTSNDGGLTTSLESWIATHAPGASLFYANGNAVAITNPTANPITPTGTYLVGGVTGAFFGGDICEVGMYSGVLTSAQVNLLNLYLANKWGY